MGIKQEFLPTKNSYEKCFIIIFLLLSMYIFENLSILKYTDGFIFKYIVKPIIWIGLIFIIWSLPRIRSKGLLKLKKFIYLWSFILGTMYIIITVLAGLIDGLGKSPYDHSVRGILINIAFVGSALVGREFIRSYLVNSIAKKENYLIFILVALLMTFTNISFKRYMDVENVTSLVKLMAETIGPQFVQNLFASYLVYLGGPLASIIYLGTILGFHWFSPILADLKWITTALIGILLPVFFMMTMQNVYNSEAKLVRTIDKEAQSPVGWIITSTISIGIIWFAVGVFPIYPSAIATGSMDPMIKQGDVILVRKIGDMEGINDLKINDVIQFTRDNILICHRIIDIYNDEEEGLGFKTKGDNNSSADSEIVKPEDVKGTIVYRVPKIGWGTLLMKSDKDIDLEKIEF